ncbi:MAG TPA: hypothetical protein VIW78_02145 [Burkholderiales bacterium]
MKKALFVAFALMGATTVFAQQGTPPAGAGKDGQTFEQRKAEILKRMDARMQEFQKARDCVQQAKDRDAMRACDPRHGGRGYGGGGPGGGPSGGPK